MDCIFCKIVKGEIPCEKVFETDDILAFNDIHPAAPTHIIVIPKKHFPTLNDIPKNELQIVAKIHDAIQEITRKAGIAESGYRTLVNTNRSAGQIVFHVHFHVMGGRSMGTMG